MVLCIYDRFLMERLLAQSHPSRLYSVCQCGGRKFMVWQSSQSGGERGGKTFQCRVKVQIFWMESLVNGEDMLPEYQSRMADLGWLSSTYHPSNLPLYIILDNVPTFVRTMPRRYWRSLTRRIMSELESRNGEGEHHLSQPILRQAGIGTKKCFGSLRDREGSNASNVAVQNAGNETSIIGAMKGEASAAPLSLAEPQCL